MTTKKVQKSSEKGKAEGSKGKADELTAERIRAILSDSNTGERVTLRLRSFIDQLGAATDTPAPETPDFYVYTFAHGAESLRVGDIARGEVEEARAVVEEITRLAERHEPKAFKVARRCREIYEAAEGDGATFFADHVDVVLEGGDDGLIPNPDSKYFVPLFVEAWNERGPRDRRVRKLLDLIKRVDEGADLNALRDEAERKWEENAAKRRPKDTRLVEALSEVLADQKREDDHDVILAALCDLHNDVRARDTDPEIFPTMMRALITKARQTGEGLDHLGTLEAIAAGR
jgi:hypothetical protein